MHVAELGNVGWVSGKGFAINFYKHHLGDYDGATAHLSWDEDMAYTRLLRAYYRREKPLADLDEACRLTRATSKSQKAAVRTILGEYFEQREDGYHNKRADEEITAYQAQASTNRRIAGERIVKRTVPRTVDESKQDRTPNQEPLTKNQKPLTKDQNLPPAAESADADPWKVGKEFLIKRGVTPSTVGAFIGGLVKDHGKDNVVSALQAAIVNEPADVKSYLVGALRGKAVKFDPYAYNAVALRGNA